jgi:ketosteroid isomerase-like protein
MSEQNLGIVRLAHEHLNEGNIDGLTTLCDRDFELDMSARTFNPETYHGHTGIRRFYREVREVWEEFRWEPLHLLEAGDNVVVLLHSHGRGRASGLEIARDVAMVWTVREGRAVSLRFYTDQAEAVKAAGLEE